MAKPVEDYTDQPREPFVIDASAVCIFLLVCILLAAMNGFYTRASAYFAPAAPISTPAIPPPAPIYYQPLPTLQPTPIVITQSVDNSDHRICVFVVDCSQ